MPRLRICGEPTVRDASASAGSSSATAPAHRLGVGEPGAEDERAVLAREPAQLRDLVEVDQRRRPRAVEVELDEHVGAALHEARVGQLRLEAAAPRRGYGGSGRPSASSRRNRTPSGPARVRHYRSSRTYGTPRLAGAPSRRRPRPDETITSTTIVITYGSAWKSCGAIVTPRACSVNGSAEKAPKTYAPTRQRSARQNAKMTSAIAIQPAPAVRPSTHCGRQREAEARAADAGEGPAGDRVERSGTS